MGATKTKIFTPSEMDIANVGRALSHPARIRIMNLLKDKPYVRNCDLIFELELCKKTVHDHLNKLKDAQLIRTEFFWNSYYVLKNDGADDVMVKFLTN
jgi:predicted transcriptional regulator